MPHKLIFNLILISLLVVIFEIAGYLTRFIDDDMYDYREMVLAEVDEAGLAEVKRGGMDPVLGWRPYGPRVTEGNNCQGNPVAYAFDHLGARVYSGYDGASAEIIVVGDSYSHDSSHCPFIGVDIYQTLMNAHLKTIPGCCAFSTWRLPSRHFQVLRG